MYWPLRNFLIFNAIDMKYVWLNLVTGEFSNSWTEEEHKQYYCESAFGKEQLEKARESHWILIKYECINDQSFELYRQMKLK